MKAADVHVPHARVIVAAGAVVVCSIILWLSRSYTFYFDEWQYILPTDTGWAYYLQPHNGHPAMLARAVYAVLLNTVGLRSYVPYMVVLLVLHATSVVLLFGLVRRRAGDLVGIAAAAMLLVLGAGWENLLWAFELDFMGSVACGLGALLVVDSRTPRLWVAGLLLFAAVMFSDIGLFFWVAAAGRLALTPGRRRDVLWLAPVVLAYGAWYLAYAHTQATPATTFSTGILGALPLYMVWGLGASVAALIGEGGSVGPVLLVLALVVIAFTWRRRRPDAFALGIAGALLAFYVVLGIARAQLGYQQAAAGRYVYEGSVFWLLVLADAARALPWHGTWRPALAACLFLACFNSSALLYEYAAAKTVQMQREVADLQALAVERKDPCLNPNASVDPLVMPQVTSPPAYYRAVDRYGDPVAGRPPIRGAAFDRAGNNLVTPGCVRPPESL